MLDSLSEVLEQGFGQHLLEQLLAMAIFGKHLLREVLVNPV